MNSVGLRGALINKLTYQESVILSLMTNEALDRCGVATRLVLSVRTVNHHVGEIARKIGAPLPSRIVEWELRRRLAEVTNQ